MAYEMVMPYHLHMPSYFLETFTEYPFLKTERPGILHAMLNLGQIRLSILVNVTNRVIILNLET